MSKDQSKDQPKANLEHLVEDIPFDDSLTTENLAAQAIAELIEDDREMSGSSSREDSTRLQQIDPEFQNAYNNI